MPRRGINYKKVLVTLDEECLALLETKKLHWDGFNQSAYIRRCIKMQERSAQKPVITQESSFEEKTLIYD